MLELCANKPGLNIHSLLLKAAVAVGDGDGAAPNSICLPITNKAEVTLNRYSFHRGGDTKGMESMLKALWPNQGHGGHSHGLATMTKAWRPWRPS